MRPKVRQTVCDCGSGFEENNCCVEIMQGLRTAQTAEQLMRSRYCAFVTFNRDYLLKSWYPSTRPDSLSFDDQQQWIGLKITHIEKGSESDDKGIVQFVARYKLNGKAHRLQERSRFVREGGHWFYVDGDHLED